MLRKTRICCAALVVAASMLAAAVTTVATSLPAAAGSKLAAGWALRSGRSLHAGAFTLAMQSDGNLVEYFYSTPVWQTATAGEPGNHLLMQKDGNLVMYGSGGQAVWQTGTWGFPNARLKLQTDGNVVVYWWNAPLWGTSWTESQAGAQQYAQVLFYHYGWSQSQFGYLNAIWSHESNWEWYVCSGGGTYPDCDYTGIAYGIPQADPGSMMASSGSDWSIDGLTQVQWGLNYIATRYGSPYNAWVHEADYGWYVRPKQSKPEAATSSSAGAGAASSKRP